MAGLLWVIAVEGELPTFPGSVSERRASVRILPTTHPGLALTLTESMKSGLRKGYVYVEEGISGSSIKATVHIAESLMSSFRCILEVSQHCEDCITTSFAYGIPKSDSIFDHCGVSIIRP
jgi:hypothetical protein